MVSIEELRKAQTTIFEWFIEQNNKEDVKKPITLLDTEITIDDKSFRLLHIITFYGRNELPPLWVDEKD